MSQILHAVIGLEIHAQIASQSKLFSGAPSHVFGQEPNSCVSFVDLAMPGMLPVINAHCIEQAALLGYAVEGTVHTYSVFERKHYMYADNPSGYQISQFKHPLVEGGKVVLVDMHGAQKIVRLNRIHVEQDAGQLLHDQLPGKSLVNFNRAGVGLMEIVSEPDLSSADEVVSYVKTIRALMRYVGVCDGDMEKGQLRVDANISVHYPGEPLGVRVEIKNMNSFRFLHQAVCYEIQRQKDCITRGEKIIQETRLFDVDKGETRTMRSKEKAQDYWYFPDPDLPPLVLSSDTLDNIKKRLPELPQAKRERFMTQYGLSLYDASLLCEDCETADFFEKVITMVPSHPERHKICANWMIGELFALLKQYPEGLSALPFSMADWAELMTNILNQTLSHALAKEVLGYMEKEGKAPHIIMRERGLEQVSDDQKIMEWIKAMCIEEAQHVTDYGAGKEKLWGYLVGKVMKMSAGKANPARIQSLLKAYLDENRQKK